MWRAGYPEGMARVDRPVSFDGIARPYRWLEYLTLGPLLMRTRMHFLPQMAGRKRVLVLGDGDGRFLAALLRRDANVHADAVDTSAAMLSLLAERTGTQRVTTHRMSALAYQPAAPIDLITTHFFLDCLTQAEADALIPRLARSLTPDGLWTVSEFRIPGGAMRWPARVCVAFLYRVFGLLTGLKVRHLPDFAAPLKAAGLVRIGMHHRLFGLLTSELWQVKPGDGAATHRSALQ